MPMDTLDLSRMYLIDYVVEQKCFDLEGKTRSSHGLKRTLPLVDLDPVRPLTSSVPMEMSNVNEKYHRIVFSVKDTLYGDCHVPYAYESA
ncbi:hypothetical protein EYZ11_005506 [Aspergillus tanneri]|uniref:Uncharacterized protein n=1 Tax=Aspergillus tanneri TaxID=1220188 RepID=A0A4S3JID9_9EURO|nr:hypothetical protein EYZ11_005506 [Aspergillus tanneri]